MFGERTLLLLACVATIYGCYLTQGLLSEHLALYKYGPQEERFKGLEVLNGVQSLTCFCVAFILVQFQKRNPGLPPWHSYWLPAVTNSVGPACGMYALKNISYSAQILAKSCKMVPVMFMGTIYGGKRYSIIEYLFMSVVGMGIGLFAYKPSGSDKRLASPNRVQGYTLCFINLVFDGFTNAFQDKVNARYPKNSPIHMMCWMNFWCALYYLIYMFGLTAAGHELVDFCLRHSDALWDLIRFCMCGAVGQLAIFFTIKTFGSLTNTLVCTTRKFFNILISVVYVGNSLNPMQWAAVGMVFTGLIGSPLVKRRGHHAKSKKE